MEISTYIDGRRPKKNGDMSVKIAVRRANSVIFVNTGLYTKTKFAGTEFPSTETNARSKSMDLIKTMSKVMELCDKNPKMPLYSLKELIDEEIFNRDTSYNTTSSNNSFSLAY